MKYKKTIKSYYTFSFILALSLGIANTQTVFAKTNITLENLSIVDSIGNEIVNGNRFLIHKLKAKETYYQLSRIYSVPVKDIISANNNKSLRVGDNVRIPRGQATEINKTASARPESSISNSNQQEFTEYKVGKLETLYAISKRFRISVDDIKRFNSLESNSLKEGQILRIPKQSLPLEIIEIEENGNIEEPDLPEIVQENQPINDSIFKPNKYGIREKKERGIGTIMSNLTADSQSSLALHKTAPIGTILKITNPMNQSVTFAKVVGKFSDNEETQGAIVVLSKSVASSIGLLDKKFQVEITYGIPLD